MTSLKPATVAGAPPRSPERSTKAVDASFVRTLEAVDSFLAAQEQLALSLRDAHHALSRAKYALASSSGATATATALPLRRPPPPPGDEDDDGEVRAERWVEVVHGAEDTQAEDESHFELRAGPAPRRKGQQRRQEASGDGGLLGEDKQPEQQEASSYDDPRSPTAPCPESIARADAARLRWAGAAGALPPPALREAQARFGEALAAAVRSASAARAALLKAERVSKSESGR